MDDECEREIDSLRHRVDVLEDNESRNKNSLASIEEALESLGQDFINLRSALMELVKYGGVSQETLDKL